ncbi:TPA: RNA-binding protein [bacterium]|jgi:RNA recognition motif-containing protein|nr:RNA-binding protein [bacterium]
MAKKLYVGNLIFGMTDSELKEAFAEFGEVVSAVVIKDRVSGRSKGFGFVEFANEDDAIKAKSALNGKELKGREVRIDDAKEQTDRRRS